LGDSGRGLYLFFRGLGNQSGNKQLVSRLPVLSIGSIWGFEFFLLFVQKEKGSGPTVLHSLDFFSLPYDLFPLKNATSFTSGQAVYYADFFFLPVNFGVVILEPSIAED